MKKKKKFVPMQQPARSDGVERADIAARQPQLASFPLVQQPGPQYMLPNVSPYQVVGNSMPMGLPQYTQIDEFGRVYTPIMSYGPQPNSAPVPIATPSKIVQLTPIVSPVSFVPYATQNQGLYQYDEDEQNR